MLISGRLRSDSWSLPEIRKGWQPYYLKNFQEVTGESVGVVFTCEGSLSVLGTVSYKTRVLANKQAIWRNLAWTSSNKFYKPTFDEECISMLEEDVTKFSAPYLRRLITWVTHRSTGINLGKVIWEKYSIRNLGTNR